MITNILVLLGIVVICWVCFPFLYRIVAFAVKHVLQFILIVAAVYLASQVISFGIVTIRSFIYGL
jgi:hypothetical protein